MSTIPGLNPFVPSAPLPASSALRAAGYDTISPGDSPFPDFYTAYAAGHAARSEIMEHDYDNGVREGRARAAMDRQYSGWTDYATWRMNLEIVSDYAAGLIADGQTIATRSEYDPDGFVALADALLGAAREMVTGEMPGDSPASWYADAFIESANWREIAQHYPELVAPADAD